MDGMRRWIRRRYLLWQAWRFERDLRECDKRITAHGLSLDRDDLPAGTMGGDIARARGRFQALIADLRRQAEAK
jgi:hypothetical protein